MKILSISAQKPSSTGSGIYLTELVRAFSELGMEQLVVAGIYPGEKTIFPEDVRFFPVFFKTELLPFPICGMSDEMPYESTRYRDMTEQMVEQFSTAFRSVLSDLVEREKPDLILCHHLYLLTAFVREWFPGQRIYGFCHNTDLRQMEKHGLRREWIRRNIASLDRVFAPQEFQLREVQRIYALPGEKLRILGVGYNRRIFRLPEERTELSLEKRGGAAWREGGREGKRLLYAGKIAEKKGVMSLLRALRLLDPALFPAASLALFLAGSAGNQEEYRRIRKLSEELPFPTVFLGLLGQEELAKQYQRADVFVLPSFFDAIPLTLVEALACGAKAVVSELPGIRRFFSENTRGANIRYVPLPGMRHADEANPEELPAFEKRLVEAVTGALLDPSDSVPDLRQLSWEGIAEKILAD